MPITKAHINLLKEGASNLGVTLTDKALAQFSTYLEELIRWSPKIDLIAQTDPVLIIRKHFLDSIAAASYLSQAGAVLDLGSGAGFPGMPLAISLPHTVVTLIEARRKRVSFLKHIARRIESSNLTVREGRAEALARETALQESFDIVITRATWNISILLELADPFLRTEGKVFALRGPRNGDEIPSLESASEKFSLIHYHDYILPFGFERRTILVFGKNVPRDT